MDVTENLMQDTSTAKEIISQLESFHNNSPFDSYLNWEFAAYYKNCANMSANEISLFCIFNYVDNGSVLSNCRFQVRSKTPSINTSKFCISISFQKCARFFARHCWLCTMLSTAIFITFKTNYISTLQVVIRNNDD